MTIQPERLSVLNDAEPRPDGDYVLYWMQASQRAHFNPALEFAVEQANALGLPVLVCFGLTDGFPEANARHYAFMLQGLAEVAAGCRERGLGFIIRRGAPDAVAAALAKKAALVVCDRGYLRIQKQWRQKLAKAVDCPVIQVEGDVVVPVAVASGKHEYAARTLRPKILRLREDFLSPLRARKVKHRASAKLPASDIDLGDWQEALQKLDVDRAVPPVRRFTGGESEARRRLKAWLDDGFARYGGERNRPESGVASELSPYLHFGQISPVEIALAVQRAAPHGGDSRTSYLEELIVRRELAINHVEYEPHYDRFDCLPDWARKTLAEHGRDKRSEIYSERELAEGRTEDRYWNAAMLEMTATGYMHNQMRMYWGKKVLLWSASPEKAFETLLRLNNRFFIDGRDPNSFANIGWIFGLHDRPWPGRPVYGSVRSMGAPSLKKFDADAYVAEVARLAAAEEAG